MIKPIFGADEALFANGGAAGIVSPDMGDDK